MNINLLCRWWIALELPRTVNCCLYCSIFVRKNTTEERSVSGGRAGAPSDTAAMLDFCANHGVAPMCEQFDMKDVHSAVERVRSGKVRYPCCFSTLNE